MIVDGRNSKSGSRKEDTVESRQPHLLTAAAVTVNSGV